MYTFTHIYIVIFIWLMWSLAILGLIWMPLFQKTEKTILWPLIILIRSVIFTAFSYWSFLFLDSFVKIMFWGQIGYGNIGYYLAPMLLALVTSIIFLIACCFSAPTKKSIITFIAIIVIYGYFFWGTAYTTLGELDGLFNPLLYVIIIEVVVGLLSLIIRKLLKKTPVIEPPLWDITAKFKSIITPRLMVLMTILSSIEVISLFEGFSFFAFGSSPDLYIQIIIDILVVFLIGIWYVFERKYQKKK